jgi:hypothetical protein
MGATQAEFKVHHPTPLASDLDKYVSFNDETGFLLTRRRYTASFRFPVPSSTSDHGGDMKRSSACTNVDGMDVKRHMEH